ncbi:hypothetical protein VC596_23900, partial [Citrobacter freundii]|uniref:hypothetical protein n=1 Tax=Citrobacter freundii TaxID=546 RepID=UPI00292BC180
ADRNRSHWSTSKTPSYTKSVSWQHHLSRVAREIEDRRSKPEYLWLRSWGQSNGKKTLPDGSISQ